MMLMKFKFNEEKARNVLNAPVNACYLKIDELLAKDGIYPKERGVYLATEKKGFHPFASLVCILPETTWFLKVIDEWYWFDDSSNCDYDDDSYNCLVSMEKYGG